MKISRVVFFFFTKNYREKYALVQSRSGGKEECDCADDDSVETMVECEFGFRCFYVYFVHGNYVEVWYSREWEVSISSLQVCCVGEKSENILHSCLTNERCEKFLENWKLARDGLFEE